MYCRGIRQCSQAQRQHPPTRASKTLFLLKEFYDLRSSSGLGEVGRDAPRLIAGEQLGRSSPWLLRVCASVARLPRQTTFCADAAIIRGQRRYHAWTPPKNNVYFYKSGWMEKASLAYWRKPKGLPSEFCLWKQISRIRRQGIIVGGHERQP